EVGDPGVTLRWEPEGWRGDASDGIGFLAWITETGIGLADRRVLLMGAGGAAHSILIKLLEHRPKSVHVVSRTSARAESLARRLAESCGSGGPTHEGLGAGGAGGRVAVTNTIRRP